VNRQQGTLPFGDSIQARFERFHDANPWVLAKLEEMTAELVAAGRRRVGIAMLFEVIRWEQLRSTTGDPFRLNNSFRSRYARLMMYRHPEWDGVFETRETRSA
jgi:hypothetical protein